ncbi:MAG: LEA type 2 family protein [Desulfococcaceae bacterium]
MIQKTALCLSLAVFLMASGCATMQQLIDPPEVHFRGMHLGDISLFDATPVFTFELINSNPMGLSIRNMTYNLKINDQKFVKGVTGQDLRLKAAGSETVELPITFNFMDLYESLSEFQSAETAAYDLSGTIGVGPFNIPYHAAGEFDIPQLPEISVEGVRVDRFTTAGASLVFDLRLKNENSFSLHPKGLDYSVKLGGIEMAEGKVREVGPISGQGATRLQIPLNVDFMELGRSGLSAIRGASADYEIAGQLNFDVAGRWGQSVPFQKVGVVNFR